MSGLPIFISLKLRPDFCAGTDEGASTSYLNLSISQAIEVRDALDICINEYHSLPG